MTSHRPLSPSHLLSAGWLTTSWKRKTQPPGVAFLTISCCPSNLLRECGRCWTMFTPLRSRSWNPGNGGGETFVLFAFVTDPTSQDVTEGTDSIEHMSDFCISWRYLFYLSVRVGCAVTETWEWNMTRGLLVFLLIEISVLNLTIVWSKLKWFISFNDKTKYFQLPSWNFCQDLLQSKQYWYCYSRSIDKGWKASGLWNRHHNKTNQS